MYLFFIIEQHLKSVYIYNEYYQQSFQYAFERILVLIIDMLLPKLHINYSKNFFKICELNSHVLVIKIDICQSKY